MTSFLERETEAPRCTARRKARPSARLTEDGPIVGQTLLRDFHNEAGHSKNVANQGSRVCVGIGKVMFGTACNYLGARPG